MKKILSRKIGFVLIVVFLLAVAGAFLFYVWSESQPKPLYVETSKFDIQENNNIKIIKNEKLGFSVEIPSDWQINQSYDEFVFTTADYKPNLEIKNYSFPFPKDGCLMRMAVKNDSDQYDYINTLLISCLKGSYCDYNVININGINALRHLSENQKADVLNYIVYLLKNNKIYFFEIYSNFLNKDDCSKLFDNFLDKIKLI